MFTFGQIVDKEKQYSQGYHINLALYYKVEKQLSSWEKTQFRYYLLINNNNSNNIVLVVRSKHSKNFPTLFFETQNSNMDASINQAITHFKEFTYNVTEEMFKERNVKINRWWDKYLLELVKENEFINIDKVNTKR